MFISTGTDIEKLCNPPRFAKFRESARYGNSSTYKTYNAIYTQISKATSTVNSQSRKALNELVAKVTTPLTVCIDEDRINLHLVPNMTQTDRRYKLVTFHLP